MSLDSKETVQKNFSNQIVALAQDWNYVGDLNNEALNDMYKLVHLDFDTKFRKPSDPDNIEAMKAELVLRREFNLRSLSFPVFDDQLTREFDNTTKNLITAVPPMETEKVISSGETSPDAVDGHVHAIKELSPDGVGTTEEAGNPPHTHNVDGFLTLPVQLNDYASDHPGKVNLNVGKARFRVTKRGEDGSLEWQSDFDIMKMNDDQHLVGGIVYEPDVIDAQDDSASAEEILKACHGYMMKSMTLGLMHERRIAKNQVALVENYIAPVSFSIGGQFVRKGSWVMVHKVLDEGLWKEVKDGKYTGFSMAGRAKDISKNPVFGKRDKKEHKSLAGLMRILEKGYDLEKVIREMDGQFCIFTEDGTKKIACHNTREGAFRQLAAIEANKSKTPQHVSQTSIGKRKKLTIKEVREQMSKSKPLKMKK